MRDEILKRLDEFVDEMIAEVDGEWGPYDDPDNDNWVRRKWRALRTTLAAERCENCLHWTAKLPEGENRPGTCCGWETGMFSIESADECDAGVFWTWSDFGCSCFKPKTREA